MFECVEYIKYSECIQCENFVQGLHWQLLKSNVLYLWKYYTQDSEIAYMSNYMSIVGHILQLIFNIILVYLIYEMSP